MKNILLSFALIVSFAACHTNTDKANNYDDTSFAAPYKTSVSYDTAKAFAESLSAKPLKSYHKSKSTARPQQEVVYTASPRVITPEAPVQTPPVIKDSSFQSPGVDNTSAANTSATIPQPEKKKGWSNASKGTVIGAGAGAIGGAILSKKKGLGAIVGGVVGAAGGYIIGKGMDKKADPLIARQ